MSELDFLTGRTIQRILNETGKYGTENKKVY
jgi:hypothetical protein